jgi:glycosyltransferase involved in cell wall biosynthesis
MRLLLLSPGFAASETDLNCIPPLQHYVREMQQQGIEIQILTFEYPFRDTPATWHGARVHSANGQNRRWLRWRSWWRVLWRAEALIRTQRPDALHSFWLGPAWVLGRLIARRWGLPHHTTLMGQDARPENHYLRYLRPRHAERLVVLSEFHRAALERSSGIRAAHCIPWGLPEADLAALPAERPVDVLGVGSMIPLKNWDKWLDALALLRQRRPGLRAELIGDGPLRGALQARAAQLGLSGQLRFRGDLPRPEVLERMRASKALLHCSDYESFGYVLGEAGLCGCRLVSTPVGIAPELAACGNSPADLADLLHTALGQPLLAQPFVPYRMADTAAQYRRILFV